MKSIIVKSCGDCPYSRNRGKMDGAYIAFPLFAPDWCGKYNLEITDKDVIHKDCKLEETEK